MASEQLKIVVYVPVSHADLVRKAIAESEAGRIGNYDSCSFSSRGIGRFRPLEGSEPYVGEAGKVEEVEEERIEFICEEAHLEPTLKEIMRVHPYEEPAMDIFPLLNNKYSEFLKK